MFKKIILMALVAICLIFSLTGCNGKELPTPDEPVAGTAAGEFEGYYSQLNYEVYNDDGTVAEQMYYLCTDEDFTHIAGQKNVYFDSEGNVKQYVVTMGMLNVEYVINYYVDEFGAIYYSKTYYDDEQKISKGEWDNTHTDPDGIKIREVGHQEYYSGGKTVKSFYLEEYHDGELHQKTTREYDETGAMTSETIE